ncbi:uncharacterized protein LOC124114393 [Haliotis rufescens]|uniref:uncharacterized protein LOC124114393 n=1 Tax=Haliotis rufescens TaxID=6454 RepID=UPI00201F9E5F|nr:uncharacterized protein LOC124114393 [Haliotis rufescens]XP_046330897.2 uncharacterized protein LOC124114393 [Haliotis rufescens]
MDSDDEGLPGAYMINILRQRETSVGTGGMDSDDEGVPRAYKTELLRRRDLHRVHMRRRLAFGKSILVYDIREKEAVIQSKSEYVPITNVPKQKYRLVLAGHYGLCEEFVYFNPEKEIAVIHDNTDLLIIFMYFQTNLRVDSSFPYARESREPRRCIGLAPTTLIGTMKSIICDNKHFNEGESLCLFHNGKRCDEDSVTVGSLFKNGEDVACIAKLNVTVPCFYMPRLNMEYKCTIDCFNTDTVGEMKQVFKNSFCTEFPGLASGVDDVWFSVGKKLENDDKYFFFGRRKTLQLLERERLVVHVKQASSFPIILRMNFQEHTSQILLMSAPFTTAALRQEVSHLTGQPPSALHLYTDNKKLKEMVLSESVGIGPNCVVLAKVAKQIRVLVTLHCEGSTKSRAVQLFKLDSVQRLKEITEEQGHFAACQLQMIFNGNELENERLMQDYRIRHDDSIAAWVFSKPEYILVRQPGSECLHLTVDGLQYTIRRLKEYLARTLGCCYVMINMIHGGRCLQDDETLEQCGLVSGSTILIPRIAMQEQSAHEGILKVFMSQEDGSFQIAFAKEAAGILFYAPESIPCDRFEKHSTKSVALDEDYRWGIISRRLSKEIKLGPCNPKPIHHNEVVHHSTQHGSEPSTSRSCTDSLAPESSRDNAYTQKKDPQRLTDKVVHHSNQHGSEPSTSRSLAPESSRCNAYIQKKDPHRLKRTHQNCVGYHTEPEYVPLKRFMYREELRENNGRYIQTKVSVLDVSKSSADEGFPHIVQTPSVQSPEKVMSTSTEHELHRSPSLQFPVGAIQDSMLQAVSQQLGTDWKRVAVELGLNHNDTENLEHNCSRNLQEQALQALLLWRKRFSKDATCAKLKNTLRECGLALIADSMDENMQYATT